MADAYSPLSDIGVPVVRHFLACESVETAPSGSRYTLVNVIHAIKPLPGASYPRIHPQLSFFVQMTDGRGKQSFQIEVIFADDEESTHTSKAVIIDLGNDPLVVHGWPIRVNNILFERPGLYEFRLLCNRRVVARESILLREST